MYQNTFLFAEMARDVVKWVEKAQTIILNIYYILIFVLLFMCIQNMDDENSILKKFLLNNIIYRNEFGNYKNKNMSLESITKQTD